MEMKYLWEICRTLLEKNYIIGACTKEKWKNILSIRFIK